ncbi:hypothetical protein Bbelb_054850 [Branchiostoma belcheri]|nr:hypothetical protein Bbelb_054850 [Branchiostoma belcheri]
MFTRCSDEGEAGQDSMWYVTCVLQALSQTLDSGRTAGHADEASTNRWLVKPRASGAQGTQTPPASIKDQGNCLRGIIKDDIYIRATPPFPSQDGGQTFCTYVPLLTESE